MLNSGFRGKRATDGTGAISVQNQSIQAIFPVIKINGYAVTDGNYIAIDDTAATSGSTVVIYGNNFVTGMTVYINNSSVATTYLDPTRIGFIMPALSNGTYVIYIITPQGAAALLTPGIVYSGFPTWSTSSYNTSVTTINIQLLAAGDTPLTYSLQNGSTLPTGITLTSTGVLTGTATSVTTDSVFYFTVIVDDAQLQSTQQSITLTFQFGDPYFKYTTLLLNGETTVTPFISDASTNSLPLVIQGDTKPTKFTPYSKGYYSNFFDGTGDYLTAPANAAWNFTGDWTFECWVYPTAITGYHTFLGQWGNPDNIFIWKMNSSGRMYLENLGAAITATSTTILANQWQHIALTRSSNTIRMFVNGVLDATTATRSSTYYSSGAMYVGAGYGEVFNGYISNMRILNGTALYTTTFTPPTTTLTAIANTSLLTCQSSLFKDSSTNAFAVTRNGDTYVTKFSPFNGTTDYTPATHGGSTVFTTTTDMLTMPTNAAFDFGTGDFTFEFWMWLPVGHSGEGAFFSGSASNSSDFVWYQSSLRFGRNAVAWDTTSSTFSPAVQQWYHIAFVKTSGTAKIFVDGVSVASASNGNSYGSAGGTVYLGRSADGSRGFAGIMSNIRIVKGTAVYTTNFTPPSSILTAISGTTFLLNGTNGGIIDQTGLNNIRVFGDAKISTSVKKYNSGSMIFDGTGDYLTIPSSPLFAFGTGNFTVEMWVYFNSISGGCALYDARDSGNSLGILIGIDGANNGPYFHVSGGTRIAGTALSNSTWYHIAVVRSSGSTKLFVNGIQAGSTYTDANSYIAGIPTIGNNSSGGGGTNYLNGYIDEFRITKGYARYTTTFTPPTAAFNAK